MVEWAKDTATLGWPGGDGRCIVNSRWFQFQYMQCVNEDWREKPTTGGLV